MSAPTSGTQARIEALFANDALLDAISNPRLEPVSADALRLWGAPPEVIRAADRREQGLRCRITRRLEVHRGVSEKWIDRRSERVWRRP